MKAFFMNDYGEGAHPLVMRRLMETNMEHTCGYGLDEYSLRAADLIRKKCGQPQAQVHMMTGGTSANIIALAAFLRPYEAAICAPTGHINVHETGAVEATGHKVLPCAAKDGKVTAEGVEAVCALHTAALNERARLSRADIALQHLVYQQKYAKQKEAGK